MAHPPCRVRVWLRLVPIAWLALACAEPAPEQAAPSGGKSDSPAVPAACAGCVNELVGCIVDGGDTCSSAFATCFLATEACPCSQPSPPEDDGCEEFDLLACLDGCDNLASPDQRLECRLACRVDPCAMPPSAEPTCQDCVARLDFCRAEEGEESERCQNEFTQCYFAVGDVVACPFRVTDCFADCDVLVNGTKRLACRLDCRRMADDPLDVDRCRQALVD